MSTLGAILAPRDHPGGPWGQQDGFEMVVYRTLFDFWLILGRRLGLPTRGFHKERIAKIDVEWKSLSMNSGIVFCCFLEALGVVFLICWPLKTYENRRIFSDITDPESGIWRGESGTDLGPQNN